MSKREDLMAEIAKARINVNSAEGKCRMAEEKLCAAEELVDELSDALGEACLTLEALEHNLDMEIDKERSYQ